MTIRESLLIAAMLCEIGVIIMCARILIEHYSENKQDRCKGNNTPREIYKLLCLLLQYGRRFRLIFSHKPHKLCKVCHLDGDLFGVIQSLHLDDKIVNLGVHSDVSPNVQVQAGRPEADQLGEAASPASPATPS